jgi:hypothetical protein
MAVSLAKGGPPRTLTPGPSPFPSRPPSQGEGRQEAFVGCAVRTVNGLQGAHSAPYENSPIKNSSSNLSLFSR